MIQRQTIWDTIKHFCNENVDNEISRQSILKYVKVGFPWVSERTVDKIRRMLTQLGYLQSIGRGKYLVMKKIEDELVSSQLEKNYLASLSNLQDLYN